MAGTLGKFAGAAAAMALLVSPTAAIASSGPSPATLSAPSTQSANAWSTLSVMSSASSSAATLAAAQGDPRYDGGVSGIPLPVIAVLLATLGVFIWILVQDDDGDGFDIDFDPTPNSPV